MPESPPSRSARRRDPLDDAGFSPDEVTRLVALKAGYDRGERRELTPLDRLRFARWLVEHGWFSDWGPTRQSRT